MEELSLDRQQTHLGPDSKRFRVPACRVKKSISFEIPTSSLVNLIGFLLQNHGTPFVDIFCYNNVAIIYDYIRTIILLQIQPFLLHTFELSWVWCFVCLPALYEKDRKRIKQGLWCAQKGVEIGLEMLRHQSIPVDEEKTIQHPTVRTGW